MQQQLPQCQMCGRKQAAYKVVQQDIGASELECCTECWKKMKMSAQHDPENIHDQLLSSLMKAAPRVTDRETKIIREHLIEAISAKMKMCASLELMDKLRDIADVIATCLRRDGKVYTCGSGSSAGEAEHFASELVGRYKIEARRGLPVVCLGANPAFFDDFAHHDIFVRQVEAYITERDVLLGISDMGNSAPVVRALRRAAEQGAFTIGLTGADGGEMLDAVRLSLVVPTSIKQTIQECQSTAIHILCDLVEQALCNDDDNAQPAVF